MKKITKATFKSFVRKNIEKLFIKTRMDFDSSDDCLRNVEYSFRKAEKKDQYETYNLGISGIWLVNSTINFFSSYEDNLYKGIEVANCCGSFIVAIQK